MHERNGCFESPLLSWKVCPREWWWESEPSSLKLGQEQMESPASDLLRRLIVYLHQRQQSVWITAIREIEYSVVSEPLEEVLLRTLGCCRALGVNTFIVLFGEAVWPLVSTVIRGTADDGLQGRGGTVTFVCFLTLPLRLYEDSAHNVEAMGSHPRVH